MSGSPCLAFGTPHNGRPSNNRAGLVFAWRIPATTTLGYVRNDRL